MKIGAAKTVNQGKAVHSIAHREPNVISTTKNGEKTNHAKCDVRLGSFGRSATGFQPFGSVNTAAQLSQPFDPSSTRLPHCGQNSFMIPCLVVDREVRLGVYVS